VNTADEQGLAAKALAEQTRQHIEAAARQARAADGARRQADAIRKARS
jgi:hypothetical protein